VISLAIPKSARLQNKESEVQMRFLRHAGGNGQNDKKRSDDLRQELQSFNLNERIDESRQRWREDRVRTSNDRLPRIINEYRLARRED
jgi:predicted RNase H-like nuclease (RuvC/YqgF family)